MFTYIGVSYLIGLGMTIREVDNVGLLKGSIKLAISPILVPIRIGYLILYK